MCRYARTTLPPSPRAAGEARVWVADLLGRWDLAPVIDDLRLVASELVSNAVLHARTVIDVALSVSDGTLELSVNDCDGRSPRPRPQRPDDTSTGGRGLFLVEALSDDWGVAERMDGKEVWFRIAAPPGSRRTAACACPHRTDDYRRTASGQRVALIEPDVLPGTG